MGKYRKKPVIVEAVELKETKESIREALKFMGTKVVLNTRAEQSRFNAFCTISLNDGGLIIKTLEGELLASFGDMIIKGVEGEFYPCKPDIFEKTYERFENNAKEYLVVYKWGRINEFGYGNANVIVNTDQAILRLSDIKNIEEDIKIEQNFKSVILLNAIPLGKEESTN